MNREIEQSTKLIANFDSKNLDETEKHGTFTRTRPQLFMLMTDHLMHHRAQMLVYMRLKGLVPSKYWEFQ